jgi:hypothetical protein
MLRLAHILRHGASVYKISSEWPQPRPTAEFEPTTQRWSGFCSTTLTPAPRMRLTGFMKLTNFWLLYAEANFRCTCTLYIQLWTCMSMFSLKVHCSKWKKKIYEGVSRPRLHLDKYLPVVHSLIISQYWINAETWIDTPPHIKINMLCQIRFVFRVKITKFTCDSFLHH